MYGYNKSLTNRCLSCNVRSYRHTLQGNWEVPTAKVGVVMEGEVPKWAW